MNYTIHEMARLLGVAPHTLRYYEKIGIIRPWTDKTNGYRYYSVVDTRRFNLCRALRAAGFSLEDCRVLLSDPQGAESAALLQKQAEELSKQAILAQLTARQLRHIQEVFGRVEENVGQIWQEHLPDAWRLTIAEGETPLKDPQKEQEKQQWLEYLPIVRWVSRIPHKTFCRYGQGRVEYAPGLMISAEDAGALSIPQTPQVEFVPGGEYACTIWRQVGRGPFDWDSLREPLAWLRQQKISAFGEGYSTILASRVNEAGRVENYHFLGVRILE